MRVGLTRGQGPFLAFDMKGMLSLFVVVLLLCSTPLLHALTEEVVTSVPLPTDGATSDLSKVGTEVVDEEESELEDRCGERFTFGPEKQLSNEVSNDALYGVASPDGNWFAYAADGYVIKLTTMNNSA